MLFRCRKERFVGAIAAPDHARASDRSYCDSFYIAPWGIQSLSNWLAEGCPLDWYKPASHKTIQDNTRHEQIVSYTSHDLCEEFHEQSVLSQS